MMLQELSEDHLASLLVAGVGCEDHKIYGSAEDKQKVVIATRIG